MEVLHLPGYTEHEKLNIAKKYLIPKEIKANALKIEEIVIEDDAVRGIIKDYTREAGVRNLEREIANVCRKVAKTVAEGKPTPVTIKAESLHDYLGNPRFFAETAVRIDRPGVVTGLAWTPTGGDILFIEATKMPGNKQLTLTGQLGDVMKESAQAALSYVRSQAEQLGINKDFYEKTDIHIHVPAGAIPKDGPSAGVTMTTAIVSMLSGRIAKHDVAMTGEITLRGKVMPIGGVKEKVLAAKRAGIKTVILPEKNKNDLQDVPEELRKEMNFIFVDTIDQVIAGSAGLAESVNMPEDEDVHSGCPHGSGSGISSTTEHRMPSGTSSGQEAPYGLQQRGLSQPDRVLERGHSHVHDPRQQLHPGLQVLQCPERNPAARGPG